MIKFRIYFDKDKETKWLNEMSQQGWAMTSFCVGVYTFEKCTEGKWNYQVDFGEKFGRCTEDYRDFMRESGIEIVQNWVYVFIVFVWVLAVINVCVKTKNTVRELEAKKRVLNRGKEEVRHLYWQLHFCAMLAVCWH